ncbi:MAG: hypothetical protein CL868_03855 [Cytophagaceae bacterium]|nr:hypothetical protein [Cytophagaceae bacterium]
MGLIKDLLYSVTTPTMLGKLNTRPIVGYYHLIDNKTPGHIKHRYSFKDIDTFVADIKLLKKYYTPLDPKLLFQEGFKIPENSFLITFDDGLRQIYQHAYPILAENGLTALNFLNPHYVDNKDLPQEYLCSVLIEHVHQSTQGKISQIADFLETRATPDAVQQSINSCAYDKRGAMTKHIMDILGFNLEQYLHEEKPYMSLQELTEMKDTGFYFGGHTMSHPRMLQLSLEEQARESMDSIDWVRQNLGLDYSAFAFPFTDKGMTTTLINKLFSYDDKLVIFGNSGIREDMHPRIVQRISLEKPERDTARHIAMENLYSTYLKLTGKYHIKRHG